VFVDRLSIPSLTAASPYESDALPCFARCAGVMQPSPPEAWLWLAVGIVGGLDVSILWTVLLAAF
jgi:hypothetical protein